MKNVFRKNKFITRIIFFLAIIFIFPCSVFAGQNLNDWEIMEFNSVITVNKNSTLDIVETIKANCGDALDKHGIFRILPTRIKIRDGTTIETPIKLLEITDEKGKSYKFQETQNFSDKTITWKIGDANTIVQGINIYKIHYTVKNAIRFGNQNFDEFYWNLNGNFWDLQTDKFHASIIFPQEINSQNTTVDYYTGALGSKSKDLATYRWGASNVLEFDSIKMFNVHQGVTVSATFPKNIFMPYRFSFSELLARYAFLAIPLVTFIICFFLWYKYGKDPKVDKTVIPEYDAPGNLSPIELGMLMKNGRFDNNLITAEIIYFATRGIITIKETSEKILFFNSKDYELEKKQNSESEQKINEAQKMILKCIFDSKQKRKLSELRDSFFAHINDIKELTEKILKDKGLIVPTGLHLGIFLKILGFLGLWAAFVLFGKSLTTLGIGLALSVVIIFFFSFIMPKRTLAGANLNWEIKGFKLFMETVDKDRAKFYEKENIFEKFLPYAIVFGITKEWIKRMEEIYGKDFYNTYAPAWYVGSMASFDANSFVSAMDSLSSDISSNTSAPSGSGGGGSAGGGGGGGGGGGW
ncbi:MAG TPA: DUF2207 domain-containing protein [Candidatus Moranbacteria bacterium]|nr:DUF2207 domain-containing protein [Candidatus Moranbacteria bacterium]